MQYCFDICSPLNIYKKLTVEPYKYVYFSLIKNIFSQMKMVFGKLKLSGGLMLIAIITFSIVNNTECDTAFNDSLEIRYFLEENILLGECDITINVSQPLHFIRLRSVPIEVINAILIDEKNNIVHNLSSASFREKNTLILDFNKQLLNATYPNKYTLNITYIRNIYENKDNYFRVAYLVEEELGYQK